MFITRASRHDKEDVRQFLRDAEWDEPDLDVGTAFIARDGGIVGCVRLVDLEPQTLVVEDVVVRKDRQSEGIGGRLMQAAMNSRGGTLYLCCDPDALAFYRNFGFEDVPFESLPEAVAEHFRKSGDYPHHEHYLKAR